MKILVVNPNTSAEVTEFIATAARKTAAPTTEIVSVTAPFGVDCIETRTELALSTHATLSAIASEGREFDAVVIAAFGDPGLGAARELLEVPVLGIGESSILTACLLGRRFSIVSISRPVSTMIQDAVSGYGLSARLASVRTLDEHLGDVASVKTTHKDSLLRIARTCVEDDGADVIILGGGPLAGLGRELADEIPVPLIDGTSAAIRMAEMLHRMAPKKAKSGTYRRPAPKASRGLSPPLARLIGGQE